MSDIWRWVADLEEQLRDSGRERIADLIDRIGSASVAEVEAMLPEALAAARSLKNPWLEVYFRHWALQARVIRDGEGRRALPEAVAALEFAHRDDTINCPQSICAAHDLLCCYANVDGPGWAEERISLAQETLDRITPSQVCFDCISGEYGDALMDQGRYAEAQAFLQKQSLALRAAGADTDYGFSYTLMLSFLHTHGAERAFAMLEECEETMDDHMALDRELLRARCLAKLGRTGEAVAAMPAYEDLAGGLYRAWADAVDAIVASAPERNTWEFGQELAMAAAALDDRGSHRDCLAVALENARLALARGSVWTADVALEVARRQVPLLRNDGGAAAAITELEQQIEAARAREVELPVPAAELLKHLDGLSERNPEDDIGLLVRACRERPDDEDLALVAALAATACAAPEKGSELLWEFLKRHNEAERVALRLLDLSLGSLGRKDAEIEVGRLAAFLDGPQKAMAHWCRARLAEESGRWREVTEQTSAVMALEPDFDSAAVLGLAARAAMEEDEFERAVSLWRTLAERSEQGGGADWDVMTAASALGDWATVRWSAGRLGMKLSSEEGPVRESWGWVRAGFEDEGRMRIYLARRTGPVTAEVVEVAHPKAAQHVHDEVVFDAALLEQAPDDEGERERWVPPFRVVHVSRSGGYVSWMLDGADPGEERLAAFGAAMEAEKWLLRRVSGDNYEVLDPEHPGQTLPGVYFFLATPASTPAAEIDARLRALTHDFKHPWCWLGLARAAGSDAEHHQHINNRYGL